MNQRSCNLADCWQELITRCGFSVSIDERGVHVSENCTNGRHGSFPDGITAVSAYHLEIIENMQERFFVLLAERDAALAKETKEVMQHAVTEFERDAALREVEQVRKTAEYWKAEHLAGNEVIERLKAPVSDDEWGKGCHLANRSHVNEIIANRSKQEKA